MPRTGVDYDTVKQTAVKLLSQGNSPSVQKIRDVLGTGSHTTIAEHLKVWRQEYANQQIQYLPANMPQELIAAMETLWQTAMAQATQQLTEVKADLDQQQAQLCVDKTAIEKLIAELRTQLAETQIKTEQQANTIQQLQTALAVSQEQTQHHLQAHEATQQQHDKRITRLREENNSLIERSEKLTLEISTLNHQLVEQSNKYQNKIEQERERQSGSETRWMKLVDQARTETDKQRQSYENKIKRQQSKLNDVQGKFAELQRDHLKQQTAFEQNKAENKDLKAKLILTDEKLHQATDNIATLQERITHLIAATKKDKPNMTESA